MSRTPGHPRPPYLRRAAEKLLGRSADGDDAPSTRPSGNVLRDINNETTHQGGAKVIPFDRTARDPRGSGRACQESLPGKAIEVEKAISARLQIIDLLIATGHGDVAREMIRRLRSIMSEPDQKHKDNAYKSFRRWCVRKNL